MSRQNTANSGLAVATVGLMLSFGLVSVEQNEALATSHLPCVASDTLSDALSLGVPGASGAAGSVNNPWIVSSAGELVKVSELANTNVTTYRSGHFRQTKEIDLEGCLFTPIGIKIGDTWPEAERNVIIQIERFHYDGGGNVIKGFRVDRSVAWSGLFTRFNSGSVKNLGLVEVSVKGTDRVGGLIGELRACSPGTVISNVYVTGAVQGTKDVGGIAGAVGDSCGVVQVLNSYANVKVTSINNPTGGLAGLTNSANTVISNTYAAGQLKVIMSAYGGLLGGSIVPNVQNSFWDTEVSSMATSRGGTGKTSNEMKTFSTFDDAGWEIVEGWEAFNFSSPTKVWGICSQVNDGYPFLLWEYTTDPCTSPPPPVVNNPPTSSAPAMSIPSAEVSDVSLSAGALANQTLVRVRLNRVPNSSEQFFIVVRLLDLRGVLIREIRVPVEPSTSSVEIPVDKQMGQFNVVALTSNAAGATAAVSLNPQTVRQSNIRKATENAPKRLSGRSLNKDVIFTADSAALSPQMKRTLRQAARLAKDANSRLAVTGFASASAVGTKFEKRLAERRALRVANFLRKQGFENWIFVQGLNSRRGGEFLGQPRRVEIRVLKR